MSNASNFFSKEEKQQIEQAIRDAENQTSGEIRVHIEQYCKEDVLDHAAFVFETLEMHKTKQRNGVLFYLSIDDHKFAILGDAGINSLVPENFWDDIKEKVISKFKEGKYAEGLIIGILQAGEELKKDFPLLNQKDNELTNEISFGKNKQKDEK
jgi:uncharacterized membrane protein